MKLPSFAYLCAGSAQEALATLSEHGDRARVLGGGQSLIANLALRTTTADILVDVNRVPDLDSLEERDSGGLALGALVRISTLEQGFLDGPWLAIPRAARLVGNVAVRTRATMGGTLANADPAAELCLVAVALDGEVVLRRSAGERRVPAAEFLRAPQTTTLSPEEMVVGIELPPVPSGAASFFEEFRERSGGVAWASACVAVAVREGKFSFARVGLGAVGPTPFRAKDAETRLVGSAIDDGVVAEAARLAAQAAEPTSDAHAPAEYRRALGEVLVKRALAGALRQCASQR